MTKEAIIAEFKSYAEGLIRNAAPQSGGSGIGAMLGKVSSLAGNAGNIEAQITSKINEYTSKFNIPGLNEELTATAASYVKQLTQKFGL